MFKWLHNIFSSTSTVENDMTTLSEDTAMNPATGLPMIGGTGGTDLEGNPYGMNNDVTGFMDDNTSICDDLFTNDPFDDVNNMGCGSMDMFDDPFNDDW